MLLVQVVAGGHHSGALDSSGCLYLWGRSYTSHTDSALPMPISDMYNQHVQQHQQDSCVHKWTQVPLAVPTIAFNCGVSWQAASWPSAACVLNTDMPVRWQQYL